MKKSSILTMGLFLILISSPESPAQPEADHERLTPEAFWSFNHCWSGSPVLDSSPGRHHLTFEGARCTPGKYGLGAGFEGQATMVETAEDVLGFTNRLTISAWVYPDSVFDSQSIVHKWYDPNSYGLFIAGGEFVFSVALTDGGPYEARAFAASREWSHVTGVFDGEAKWIKIYVNGQLRDTTRFQEEPPLQPSARPLVIGSHPRWSDFRGRIDEVGLYDAAFTAAEVRSLAGRDGPVFFGSDSFTYPERNTYRPEELGYDFYIGRLGAAAEACRIRERGSQIDVLNGSKDAPDCCFDRDGCARSRDRLKCPCAFAYEAALIARPERTYGFWLLAGPDHRDASFFRRWDLLPFFGSLQASRTSSQRTTYNHLLGGRTLFADVERCLSCAPGNDTSGWRQCDPSRPEACSANRAVLEGFLQGVDELGLTPGVYTRRDIWDAFFGPNYVPRRASGEPIPFVLWLTGYHTTNTAGGGPSDPDKVATLLREAEKQFLGGMSTVVWQHHIEDPDWDATRQNPSGNFEPKLGQIRLFFTYSFEDQTGRATVLPGDIHTIWDQPGGCGPVFRDVAQCETNMKGEVRAFNHDCLSGDGPGKHGEWVGDGCSSAEDFGYSVRCCLRR